MRVAIVGAGAAGLCCARHLSKLLKSFEIRVFEQSQSVGGTWVYSDDHVHSSIYKSLRTNLPKEVMEFPGFPFRSDLPSFMYHWDVLQYLEDYTLHYDLSRFIQFGSLVEQVSLLHTSKSECQAERESVDAFEDGVGWRVTTRSLSTGERTSEDFDAVLICNGHYFVPRVPALEGMEHFTGKVLHCHLYREPSLFSGQCVLVVGAGPSGRDIMLDLAPVAKAVYISSRGKPIQSKLPANIICLPEIERIEPDGGICFKNGCKNYFDAILFCTGYEYKFPFLGEDSGIVVQPGRVCTLYKQTFNYVHPSMAVIGINVRIVPFPLFDLQIRWILSVWSGEKSLPTKDEMVRDTEDWYRKRLRDGLPPHLAAHYLGGTVQFDFYDELADLGGSERLPPVKKQLYLECSKRMTSDLMHYKESEFEVLNNTEWI